VDVHITQFNVQLYFKNPVLTSEKLDAAFSRSDGLSRSSMTGHPMQNTVSFYREGFRIAPVQSNVLPDRILQIMSYPNALKEPDSETLACLDFVDDLLRRQLGINTSDETYAARVVFHSIVTGSNDVHRMLSVLTSIDDVPSVAGKFVGHKNPMDAIQLTSVTGSRLIQDFWSDIRISQFNTNSYVVTIFHETGSSAGAGEFIRNSKRFVTTMMQEMEAAVSAQKHVDRN
jgi:hypothetical protein